MKSKNLIISLNRVFYAIKDRKIINDITLNLYDKDITVIMGHNGAGKSTLLKLMANILKPSSGIILNGKMNNKRLQSSFVFQKPVLLNRSVMDNILHPLDYNSADKNQKIKYIESNLSKYNILYLLNSNAKKISAGEQQLVSIIRALITEPKVLFLDEPTANLDQEFQLIIEDLIMDLSSSMKIILVTHSMRQSQKFTSKPHLMNNGALIK